MFPTAQRQQCRAQVRLELSDNQAKEGWSTITAPERNNSPAFSVRVLQKTHLVPWYFRALMSHSPSSTQRNEFIAVLQMQYMHIYHC